jgi:spore coat protein U-like protein
MKRSVTYLIAVLAVVLAVPSFAANTATANLAVSATVSQVCTITTAPVAFGAYDPIVTNNTAVLNGTGGVTVTCTKGASGVWVGLAAGGNSANAVGTTRAMNTGTNYLSYELYKDSGRSLVWGNTTASGASGTGQTVTFSSGAGLTNPATMTVYGQVPAGQNVPAGSYGDTVVATVNY